MAINSGLGLRTATVFALRLATSYLGHFGISLGQVVRLSNENGGIKLNTQVFQP